MITWHSLYLPIPQTFRFCPRCLSPLEPGKACLLCHLVSINTILAATRKPVGIPTRKDTAPCPASRYTAPSPSPQPSS